MHKFVVIDMLVSCTLSTLWQSTQKTCPTSGFVAFFGRSEFSQGCLCNTMCSQGDAEAFLATDIDWSLRPINNWLVVAPKLSDKFSKFAIWFDCKKGICSYQESRLI